MDLNGQSDTKLSRSPDAIVGDVRRVRREIEASPKPGLPLYFTEWSSSYTARDPVHDSYHSASYILSKLKQTSGSVQGMSLVSDGADGVRDERILGAAMAAVLIDLLGFTLLDDRVGPLVRDGVHGAGLLLVRGVLPAGQDILLEARHRRRLPVIGAQLRVRQLAPLARAAIAVNPVFGR